MINIWATMESNDDNNNTKDNSRLLPHELARTRMDIVVAEINFTNSDCCEFTWKLIYLFKLHVEFAT